MQRRPRIPVRCPVLSAGTVCCTCCLLLCCCVAGEGTEPLALNPVKLEAAFFVGDPLMEDPRVVPEGTVVAPPPVAAAPAKAGAKGASTSPPSLSPEHTPLPPSLSHLNIDSVCVLLQRTSNPLEVFCGIHVTPCSECLTPPVGHGFPVVCMAPCALRCRCPRGPSRLACPSDPGGDTQACHCGRDSAGGGCDRSRPC
jgi:hypothetical protein